MRAGRAAQPGAAAKESDQDLMSAPVTRASSRTEHPDGPVADITAAEHQVKRGRRAECRSTLAHRSDS